MSVLPGAEAYSHQGGPTGVLLCHGFTSSPQSLRPWAEYLAEAGLTVSLPRLPGHGTTWQELARTRWEDWYAEIDRACDELRQTTDEIFIMGLSMGGCLALRLAELRGNAVGGLVIVNPFITPNTKLLRLAPLLKAVVPSVKGVGSDIKKEGMVELAYDRTPAKAAATLLAMFRVTTRNIGQVTAPVLCYHSPQDHVLGPENVKILRDALPASQLEVRECPDSYHVATLDNDAETIFAGSLDFVRSHSHAGKE